ncbi:MAG: aminotransferase class V-fold PLP-dependent enzyme [Planctomycetota bacterium]
MTPTNFIYLDNAATTFPKPPEVIQAAADFYMTKGVNPGRTGFDLALEAEEMIANCRKELCGFFGGTEPNRLVFGHNVTDALNHVIDSTLQEGDHAITTYLEHNSVIRPLHNAETKRGVEVDWVPFDENGYVDPAAIGNLIKDNTKLVVCTHGSNVIGTVQPVAEIGRICREKGVLLAVDCAQTAGMIPIDVAAMNIDILCFTGHKSLMAPPGSGGMYVAEHVDVWPSRSGGTGVKSALKTHVKQYPWRFEFGTLNLLGVAGLYEGQKWIAARGGIEAIYAHEMELASRLKDGMAAIDGVEFYCADLSRDHLPVFAWNLGDMPAGQAGTILDVDHDVICRTGLHCAPMVHEGIGTFDRDGTCRFSVGAYTTADEVDRAIAAVRDLATM